MVEAIRAEISTLHYVPIKGPLNGARSIIFSTVPGFKGLTSWGKETYAVFQTKPSPQAEARLHQLAGGP